MEYVITPYTELTESWCYWENGFSNEELDWLQNKAIEADQRALVGGTSDVDYEKNISFIRRSHVSWLTFYECGWVFEKLSNIVTQLNSQFYNFDIIGFGEKIQLTNYNQTEHGMYGWHQDSGGKGVSRKLSLVLQLSHPNEYVGGNLQIKTGMMVDTLSRKRGHLFLFPSYTLHQVTPVVSGSRQSLVAWISGPKFK